LTRQVVAMHAGGRSEADAKAFWEEIPEPYRSGCDIYTDEWEAYRGAIPPEVHFPVKKLRKNKSCRRGKLHSTATNKSTCEKNSGFLENTLQSHRSYSVLLESL
jgi:IS1 family transposase